MSLRDGPLNDLRPPLGWLATAALGVAFLAALALFLGDHRGPAVHGPSPTWLRGRFDSLAGAAGGVLSAPIHWAGDAVDAAGAYVAAGSQNRSLRARLAQDRTLEDRIAALQLENARLRSLLGVRTDPPIPMVSARTVLDAHGAFAETRLADAGARDGVIEGNPVVSDRGLVGRVIAVGPRVSRIMLLTDMESRIPVLFARTNGRAILTGDGGPSPRLAYVRTHDPLRPGDRILTSGDGGVIPRGLPVGVVQRAGDGWRVALATDGSSIDLVRILLFKDFSQLQAPTDVAPRVLPPTTTEAPPPAAPASSGAAPAAQPTAAGPAAAPASNPGAGAP